VAIRKPSEYFDREKASVENTIQGSIENTELNTFSDAYDAFKRNLSKVDVLTDFSETLENYQSNIEKVNHLSEKIEELDDDIKNLLTKEDLDKALVSQLLFLEECIRDVQDKVKSINQKNLTQVKLDVSSLTETVHTFVDNELPRYKKLVSDSEIRLTNRCEVLEEELKETLDNIKDVVDEKYIEDFNSLNEELGRIKNNDIPKYKNLIVDSEIKTDSKIKEFAEFLDNTVNDIVSKIELVKEDNTEIFDTLNFKVSEVNQIHNLMLEDIEKSETTRDELDKKVVDLKIEILRNESHIENQNKSIETIHEDVKSAIDKLSIEEIRKNNSRLASKVKYIEEVFEKFNEKEILNESIITEPSSSENSDPLTPLDQKFVTLDQLQSHYRLFVNRIQQQLSSLGGGGEVRLEFLDDVDRDSAKVNNKFLKYDSASGKWVGANASGGAGSQTLDETLELGDTSTRGMSVGVVTSTKLHIDPVGSGVTYSENLVVLGNGRVTGILSIGTSSIVLDPNNKKITGIEELELGTTTLKHDAVGNITFVNTTNPTEIINVGIGTTVSINTSGIITASSFSGSGVNLTNIPNTSLDNNSVSFGGVSVDLGSSDATPAFDLSDATNYPTSSLSGTITNAQLAGSIANAKLANDSVSYGGVSLDLGQSDATPAFDLSDATNYPTSSLSGTITNAQLAGSIANAKLSNSSIAIGGVTLNLGDTDATPAFDLSDATAYPYTSLTGITTSIVGDTTPQLGGNLDLNNNSITGTGNLNISGVSTFSGDVTITSTGNLILDSNGPQKIIFKDSSIDGLELAYYTNGDYLSIQKSSNTHSLLRAYRDEGQIELYYSNAKKLETTGIGISVLNGDSNTATIAGPSNLIIDPGVVGDNTGIVRIKGDLYVDGTETFVNSTTVEIADKVIGIATTCTSNLLTDGAGIGIGSDKTFLYEFNSGTNPSLKSSENLNVLTGKGYQVNQVEVLNATTLGSGVTISSLTSVGTLTALTSTGTIKFQTAASSAGQTAFLVQDGSASPTDVFRIYENGETVIRNIVYFGPSGSQSRINPNGSSIFLGDMSIRDGSTTNIFLENNGDATFKGDLSIADKIIHDGDTDTAIRFPTADTVTVETAGTEKLRITSAGNVGIGSEIPSEKLDVNGTVKATTFSGNLPTTDLTGTITNAQLAGSIANAKLANDSVSFGGVSLDLGTSDATPAFDLSDATNYPTSSLSGTITNAQLAGSIADGKLASTFLKNVVEDTTPQLGGNLDLNGKFITGTGGINVTGVVTATTFSGNLPTTDLTGTITNAQLAGSIANAKLVNDSVSFGGVSLDLGASDATPAFDLSDATAYPTSSLTGTITNAQLAGSIANAKLANDSVSYGGVSLDLGGTDATPAFDLSDATNYPTSSLTGTITNAQLAGSIADGKLASTFLKNVVEDTTPQLGGNLDLNGKFITGTGGINVTGVVTATSFSAADTFIVETAGSERVSVTSAGNVGIGSVIPQANLEVYGTTRFKATDGSHGIEFYPDVTGLGFQRIISFNRTSSAYENLSFGVNEFIVTNQNIVERFRVTSAGNVGIGSTIPTSKLDVSGDAKVSGVITATTFSGNLPTTDLTGTITNAQLAGSIANAKLVNDSVSFGGVSLDLGASDATPAFDLSDATAYPTSSLTGTITNAQLAGSIANAKLANDSVSYGGVSLDLGGTDATPAFDLSDATNYPTSSLTGTITNAQLAGSIADGKLASTFLKNVVEDTTPQLGGNLDLNGKFITGTGGINVTGVVTATSMQLLKGSDIFPDNSDYDRLVVQNSTSGQGAALQIVGPTNGVSEIGFSDNQRNAGLLSYSHSNNSMNFDANGANRVTILSGGNVGVNQSNPTEQLEVNGTCKATAFVGNGSGLTNLPGGGGGISNYVKYVGTGTPDLNASTSYAEVSWINTTPQFSNGTWSATSSHVVVPNNGIYLVQVNFYITASVTRSNIGLKFAVNDTQQTEIAANNYIRNTSGHQESSINMATTLSLSANDQVSIYVARLSASGTVSLQGTSSTLAITQLA